jgi:Lon-like protease
LVPPPQEPPIAPEPSEPPIPPDAGEPPTPSRLGRVPTVVLALIPLLSLVLVLRAVELPFFVFAPGSAQEVEPLIHVSDHQTFGSKGHFLLTDVVFYQPNSFQAVVAWLRSTEALYHQEQLLAPGQSQQQFVRQGFSQMDMSKIDAAIVALHRETGYDPRGRGPGVLVENVAPRAPATNRLFAGDVIAKVNGTDARTVRQVARAIRAAGFGHRVTFLVRAGGRTRTVALTTGHLPDVSYPVVGVSLVANFPFPVTISSGDIGGSSAGLMWTLGLIDVLSPGDLTGGRTIAGTGTIDSNGDVGEIGGVVQKVAAAETAGATVFFVPVANANEAATVAHGITLVPVKTYQQALKWLTDHGGTL